LAGASLTRIGVRYAAGDVDDPIAVVPPTHHSIRRFWIVIGLTRCWLFVQRIIVIRILEGLRGVSSHPNKRLIPIPIGTKIIMGRFNRQSDIGIEHPEEHRYYHQGTSHLR